MSNLLRKCRKKSTDKETGQSAPNTNQSHSVNQRMAQVDLVHSVYDDIDETMFVENDNIRPQQTKPSAVASIDSSYLFPCHSEDDSISSHPSEKGVNKSFVSSFETDQNKTPDNHDACDNDDTTSYLHPYHTIDEDCKEKTHQYDITYSPHIDNDCFSDASVQLTHDGYLNPYQPLKENWKQTSHIYEVPVTIHQCLESSLTSSLTSIWGRKEKETDEDKT